MSKIDAGIFRAYDIRGIFGKSLTLDDAYLIGKAFGTYTIRHEGPKICIGRDGRVSSPDLEESFIKGLLETGCRVIKIGLGPTPMAYFAQKYLGADGVVMISGSHNPADYNGFKFTLKSRPLYGQDIQELYHLIQAQDFEEGIGVLKERSILETYVARLARDFHSHYTIVKNPKVVWDTGNGAAGPVVQSLIGQLPGEHILINGEVDGTFPAHGPDPSIIENLAQLQERVLAENADFGIAFDGDADRIAVVASDGTPLLGDTLSCLFAEEVLKGHPGAIIMGDVKASQTYFDHIQKHGGQPLMWACGHSLIKAQMMQNGCPFAGELSGHLFFADRYYGFDDAIYAAQRFIGIAATMDQSLLNWLATLPKMETTPEHRLECPEDVKFKIIDFVKEKLNHGVSEICDKDGLRVKNNLGWWLLRASNTQPELSIRLEASSLEDLKMLKKELSGYLKEAGVKKTAL